LATLLLWFFILFFGGISCLKMSPRLIVMIIRHIPRWPPGLPIIPYPSLGLGKRPGIVPPEVECLYDGDRALSPKIVTVF
jgi:hypothetical protein